MSSETLRFFNMGFLFRKELFFDRLLVDSEFCSDMRYELAVCNGPYNHVTSQSFSLYKKLAFETCAFDKILAYQFKFCGWTVLRLFLCFAHVRHEAFSRRDFSP